MMNTPTDDDWIDLSALYSSSFSHDGCIVLDYDWCEKQNEMKTDRVILHQLRKALRKVGHTITKIRSGYKDFRCVWTIYYTTITDEEGEKMRKLWNDWIHGVAEEEHIVQDESDDENESVKVGDIEDDNPSN